MASACSLRETIDGYDQRIGDGIAVMSLAGAAAGIGPDTLIELCQSPALAPVPLLTVAFGETEESAEAAPESPPKRTLLQMPQARA